MRTNKKALSSLVIAVIIVAALALFVIPLFTWINPWHPPHPEPTDYPAERIAIEQITFTQFNSTIYVRSIGENAATLQSVLICPVSAPENTTVYEAEKYLRLRF